MIVYYDTETGAVQATAIGQDDAWTDEMLKDWTDENPKQTAVKIEDAKIMDKYYDASSGSLKDATDFNITLSKEKVQSNNSDYIDFSGIPEDSKISVDNGDDATMDASGVFRFTCTDPGIYQIRVKKHGYNWYYKEITAYDNV
tara:strand:+ start:1563 stop:1991 length:429 start_codon:yes stop_codon:yes gene_type:complete